MQTSLAVVAVFGVLFVIVVIIAVVVALSFFSFVFVVVVVVVVCVVLSNKELSGNTLESVVPVIAVVVENPESKTTNQLNCELLKFDKTTIWKRRDRSHQPYKT